MNNDVVGKLVADKYRIDSLIRENESGDLYLGHNEAFESPVTVKVLSSAYAVDARWVKKFIDEARASSSLSNPNILGITDFGTDAKNISYAVYEAFDGQPLGDIIAAEEPLDEKRALNIARQIATALAAAHEKKIVHGRLAPNSILLGVDDEAKLFGFGADPLKVARDADPRYLAPEQWTAFPAADERSDVYSLGVLLYEMLSGSVPYDGATAADILANQNSEPPAPLSAFRRDLHPEIEPIVLSSMAADPERRYSTMAAFAEDLETLANRLGIPISSNVTSASHPAKKRNIWQTAFVALAGISILAVALIYATSVRKTDPTTQLQADAGSLPVQPIGPATGAQEESLARLPAMTEAEILASAETQTPDMVPGGDGYNAWANGGKPPPGAPPGMPLAGAPLNQNFPMYVQPGGQYYTVEPGGSQFMPNESGVILVPVPANSEPAAKASPTAKTPPANAAVIEPAPVTAATPKTMATPPPKAEKTPAAKPATKGKQPSSTPGSGDSGNESEAPSVDF